MESSLAQPGTVLHRHKSVSFACLFKSCQFKNLRFFKRFQAIFLIQCLTFLCALSHIQSAHIKLHRKQLASTKLSDFLWLIALKWTNTQQLSQNAVNKVGCVFSERKQSVFNLQ